MPEYKVIYIDTDGKKKKKDFEIENKEEILNILKENNQTLLQIEKKGKFLSYIKDKMNQMSQVNVFGTTVKSTTLILFARQMGSMLGAGIPILDALRTLLKDVENIEFKKTLEKVVDDISSGIAFSDSIAKFPKIFSNLFVNMIRSAEASGGLSVTLKSISEYLEKIKDIKEKIKSATRYPLIVLVLVLLATFGMTVFIIPKFQGIYQKLGGNLPLITKILLNISKFSRTYFPLIIIGIIALIIGIRYLISNYRKIKLWYHKFLLKFPKLGKIYQMGILINFSKTFGLLIRSGINIIDAIELSKNIINNLVYRDSLSRIKDKIESGNSIYNSFLEEQELYPNIFLQMIGTGEETGAIDDLLIDFNEYFENEVNKTIDKLSQSLEHILIVFIAGVVLFIVLSIYLPIFKLGDVMKNIG